MKTAELHRKAIRAGFTEKQANFMVAFALWLVMTQEGDGPDGPDSDFDDSGSGLFLDRAEGVAAETGRGPERIAGRRETVVGREIKLTIEVV